MRPVPPPDLGRWRQIETLLDQALDLPQEERVALLDTACAGDPELRADVESLLAADAAAGGFLGVPAGEYAPDLLADAADADNGEADLAGRQVGPYRLLREIGSGGMGTVYEAEDVRLGRRVAVKILPSEVSRDPRAKERFLREARAASAVDHPNLCTVHDVGESGEGGGRLYIVLSFYEGETLRERLRRGPLPAEEARGIAIQIARGLARAHEAGIIHRDLKPANVMLTRRGEVKILDFGIARLEGDEASLTRTGALWGTPVYMSPEQARGAPVDRRTDVWSLGVLLYEMVAGRRPFGGEDVQAVLSAILIAEPEPLERLRPDVPPDLAQVAARALAKAPAERYASAADLLADLEAGPRPARGHRIKGLRKVFLAAGALATLTLLGAVLVRRPWHAAPPVRVAVLRPSMTPVGNDPELAFVASEVMESTLATLVSLEGVHPLDPPEKDEARGSAAETLRSKEADEVLLSLLDCRGEWCRVTLRRVGQPGGDVLATAGPFEVQAGPDNAYQLAEGVRVHLQRIYPDHPPRSSGASVRPEDYTAYIQLERRIDQGERVGPEELARLDALLRTSPDLVGAALLAAGIARNQGALDRALAYAERAEKLAPHDPRPLAIRLRIEAAGHNFDGARATLGRLAALAPGDVRVQSAEAELLEARGKLREARRLRQEVAQRRPTWRHIRELAALELSMGASEDARRLLDGLLAANPDNQYLLEDLAALEVTFGDLQRAAALYEKLNSIRPQLSYYTSLGFVRLVLGDYAAATAANRQALSLEPKHLLTRFNLATSLDAQGDLDGAHRLYRALAEEIAALPVLPDAQTRMLHALCLARLGRRSDAAGILDGVLEQKLEDVQVLYQVAQVYTLLGDRVSARYYVKLARDKGLRREWFTIPVFNSLKEDPDFRALLDTPPAHKVAG
jgi:serine/threonine-protein kinase